jgi:hypothetical protein
VETFTTVHARHFTTAAPPELPEPGAAAARHQDRWDYRHDYLSGYAATTEGNAVALDAEVIKAYLPKALAADTAKSSLLTLMVYLRSMPVLRGVVRRIPAHWQRQVKSWLRA